MAIFRAMFINHEMNSKESFLVLRESQNLKNYLIATRTYYQKLFVKQHISLNKDTLQFLPAFASTPILKEFSKRSQNGIILKTVSDNPRNKKNLADKYEVEAIKYLRANPDKKEYFVKKDTFYQYAYPIKVNEVCLRCHLSKDASPEFIAQHYNKAYDYNVGDIRGIISVKTPIEGVKSEFFKSFIIDTSVMATIFVILVVCVYYLINRLIKELKENEENHLMLLRQSKLATMGEMIAMIAHQWRQPVTAISAIAQSIMFKKKLNKMQDVDLEKELSSIKDISFHLSSTIDDFRDFFKPNKDKDYIEPKLLLQDTLSLLEHQLKNKSISVSLDSSFDDKMYIYKGEFTQVILNIINNAKDALIQKNIENKKIDIKLSQKDNKLLLSIQDNAGGIGVDIIDSIFDPYFSTKGHNGTGLGLYMSKVIIESHLKGVLKVENRENGARFIIELPIDKKVTK
jgi:signal transduction histidine kinase